PSFDSRHDCAFAHVEARRRAVLEERETVAAVCDADREITVRQGPAPQLSQVRDEILGGPAASHGLRSSDQGQGPAGCVRSRQAAAASRIRARLRILRSLISLSCSSLQQRSCRRGGAVSDTYAMSRKTDARVTPRLSRAGQRRTQPPIAPTDRAAQARAARAGSERTAA